MSATRSSLFLVLLSLLNIYVMSSDVVSITASDSADGPGQTPPLRPAAAGGSPPAFVAAGGPSALNLLSSFPEELEVSGYCTELLRLFGLRYVAYLDCLVPAARPVHVCLNCFSGYGSLTDIYANISNQVGPGNESCADSLLRSDRLMLVYLLYNNLRDVWVKSACNSCITEGFQGLTSDTLYFMSILNRTLTCFQSYQQGNHTDLCRNCKSSYRELSELFGRMENNHTVCIDIEDSVNVTRRLWSKTFNCSLPREETVPVIAVSSFMLFLPIIFYLSSFLHSEQKKRKLIHPNRAKSYTSLVNIQDTQS